VAAATLSNRYITNRFLPDKAIDLVDEACAGIKVEIESMPTDLDEVDRKIRTLEVEKAALQKESDESSQKRLISLQHELEDANAKKATLTQEWEVEKGQIKEAKDLKQAIEKAKLDLDNYFTAWQLRESLRAPVQDHPRDGEETQAS
jgi:ATP-dependent Clp protease ATP-binding subunit ClpB